MKLIVSNHKMNFTKDEILNYVRSIESIKSTKNKLVFCPSFPYLPYFNKKGYALGSQNISYKEIGNLTGEVGVHQLKSLGVEYVIIGHSERRIQLKETKEEIEGKVSICLKNDLIPILCIGEENNERSKIKVILKEQIDEAFEKNNQLEKIIIAYEPVWAIGTGKMPTLEEITKTIDFIKSYTKVTYGIDSKVLYGGSVNEETIKDLKKIETIDGYLIGRTSLKIDSLKKINEELEVDYDVKYN